MDFRIPSSPVYLEFSNVQGIRFNVKTLTPEVKRLLSPTPGPRVVLEHVIQLAKSGVRTLLEHC